MIFDKFQFSVNKHAWYCYSHFPITQGVRFLELRVCSRFFDQVGHDTMYASSGTKQFSLSLVIVGPTKIMNRADKNWAQF